MTLKALWIFLALATLSPGAVLAVEPDEILNDPALEARARDVGRGLRCVVCQNQSIDESNADLARDMRILVRDRIKSGDTNDQVMAYMVDRYGDFVLLDPPFKASTVVLWVGPAVIAGFGLLAVFGFYRRRKNDGVEGSTAGAEQGPNTVPLTAQERKRLKALLKEDDA